MKCDRCYYENPEDKTHCINCGAKLPEKKIDEHMQDALNEKLEHYYKTTYKKPESEPETPKVECYIQYSKPKKHKPNDYYKTTYRGPSNTTQSEPKTGKKLWITIVLAILFVGLGQVYLKEYKKAAVFMAISIITSILAMHSQVFLILGTFNAIYQLLDAINDYKKTYVSKI